MRRQDGLASGQVGNCAGQLQRAMIGARRKVELAHRRAHQAVASFVQFAELAHLGHAHIGVTDNIRRTGLRKALQLSLAGGLHALADVGGSLAEPVAAQFFVIHPRHLDVDVDPVEHRAGNPFLVLGHGRRGAGAGLLRIAIITARTRVHSCHQLEVGTKGQRSLGAADGDNFVLHRLAHNFDGAAAEFGELVQEQYAAMGQRNLAGVGNIPAANQAGMADGMVRRPERPLADERRTRRELVGDRVDFGHFERFFQRHLGQDTRQGARQQGFAGPRAANHQYVMPKRPYLFRP